MPLSGVFSWFWYIYVNEGIKRRAAEEEFQGGRRAVRQEGRRAMATERGGMWTGECVQARLCGIDGSFRLRTLLDKARDDTRSKPTSGLLLSACRLGGG